MFIGTFSQENHYRWIDNDFMCHKLFAVEAVGLHQQAGPCFALLRSLVLPSSMPKVALFTLAESLKEVVHLLMKTDLMSAIYEIRSMSLCIQALLRVGNVSCIFIKFHRLFVEWNPEALAATQNATRAVPVEGLDGPTDPFPEMGVASSSSSTSFLLNGTLKLLQRFKMQRDRCPLRD